jgi:tetratricopeptide (TPR) repeat protein
MKNFPLKRSTVSLCMIVKNEEKFLEGCLLSVKDIVDEIIIVDTGSTDRTKEIAGSFNAKIYDFEWQDDFAKARNESLRHAAGDWVLYLDADERIAGGQEKLFSRLVDRKKAGAYNVWIEGSYTYQDDTVVQRFAYVRLFRRRPSVLFEGTVHEQINPSLIKAGIGIEPCSLVIEHLGYGQGYDIVVEKAKRNCRILRHQVEQEPKNAYARYQLGNTLSVLGEYDEAYIVLRDALDFQSLDASVAACAWNLLAEIDARKNRYEDTVHDAQQSIRCAHYQQLGPWFLACGYLGKEQYPEALEALNSMETMKLPSVGERTPGFDSVIDGWKIDARKAACYAGLNSYAKAGDALNASLKNGKDIHFILDLFGTILQRKEPDPQWAGTICSIKEKNPDVPELSLLLAHQYWRLQSRSAALEVVRNIHLRFPQFKIAYIVEAEWIHAMGDYGKIDGILQQARSAGVLSYPLFQRAIDGALKSKNTASALSYLNAMNAAVSGQIPEQLRPKYDALKAKLEQIQRI